MDKQSLFCIGLLLLSVLVGTISQVMLKKSAMKTYSSFLREYLNPLVIFAYVLFVGTTILTILAYRGVSLSLGAVLEASSYIYVTIFGVTIFKEKMNRRKLLALGLILAGIALYALCE